MVRSLSGWVGTMIVVRLGKTALVAAIAFFFTLVAFGNITDYGSNWQFVLGCSHGLTKTGPTDRNK